MTYFEFPIIIPYQNYRIIIDEQLGKFSGRYYTLKITDELDNTIIPRIILSIQDINSIFVSFSNFLTGYLYLPFSNTVESMIAGASPQSVTLEISHEDYADDIDVALFILDIINNKMISMYNFILDIDIVDELHDTLEFLVLNYSAT